MCVSVYMCVYLYMCLYEYIYICILSIYVRVYVSAGYVHMCISLDM